LAEDKQVELEYDEYQDDKFGRILAYVWVPCTTEKGCQEGKLMLNESLVEEGLAKVVIYEKRKKLKYQEELIKAEEEAKEENLGIWEK
jgi:micrococcal nuclease